MRTCPVCKRSWQPEFRVCPIDGAALEESAAGTDSFIGSTIGRCRLVEKIADGDLGPVFKAEDPEHGVSAVQIVHKERLASPVLLDSFSSAVKLASQLNHPHAIRIFGTETDSGGNLSVFMEYVEGTTLQQYRKSNPAIAINEACAMVRQAAEALIAAHRLSLLHGALHPARIFVTRSGAVKIGGFHRSGIREGTDVFTATAENLPYLSPEQVGILRDVPVPDYRTDVYSLGVILYELLSGRVPFDAKSVQDLSILCEGKPPLPPSFTNPQVSPLLSRIILKAISKHPSERHGSMEEFARELDAANQPQREPQRPVAPPRYEPQYPPPSAADSGLFSPPPPSQRKEPAENIWPESADRKQKQGEGSLFGWFQTRSGSHDSAKRAGSGRESSPLDDSFFSSAPSRREDKDDFQEHTVVVSQSGRKSNRRSFSDTFAGTWFRSGEGTSTNLPRRRFSSRLYIGLGIGAAVLLAAILILFLIFGVSPAGKLSIMSVPAGAQVWINDEFKGLTPLPPTEIKAGPHNVRVKLEGYESQSELIDIEKNQSKERLFQLIKEAPLATPPLASAPPETPAVPPLQPSTSITPPAGSKAVSLAGPFNNALRSRSLFPPSPENASDILFKWRQSEGMSPSPAWEQARSAFCREVEVMGQEKLDQKDFAGVRNLLDQAKRRDFGIPCAANLKTNYDHAISKSRENLMASARAAIDRQNYITPENDNALRYLRLAESIDPQDAEAKAMDSDIFSRALEQAQAKSKQRQHQEAIDIYRQLKIHYPNPPGGMAAIDQNLSAQSHKLDLMQKLKTPYSVQVQHNHGRKMLVFGKQDCTGILRVDGFNINYNSPGGHNFNIAYQNLQGATLDKNRKTIVIQGVGIPDGKIELDQVEKAPNPSLAEIYVKIQELRQLNAEYMK